MSFYNAKLDKTVPIPLYFQLKKLIISEIQSGNYADDSVIPTENEFSEIFSISRTTVRQAITELVQEGWLYRIKSKGTFVTHPKINQDFIQRLESFNEQILRSGRTPSTHLLDFQLISADDIIAVNLNLKKQAKVFLIHRIRYADNEPIVILKTYVPYDACPSLLDYDFAKDSLYAVLGQREASRIHHVKRLVEAVSASEEDCLHLQLETGKPIQFFTSIGYTADNIPVEYSLARYRGDKSQFEITVYAKDS